MPKVPGDFNMSAYGQSPLGPAAPSQANLLMAAADMHEQGALKSPQGPERPALGAMRKVRKLKVVK